MSLSVSINKVIFPESNHPALFDLLAENGVINIRGENGSGKTSILRALAGIYKFEGSVTLNSKDIRRLDPKEKLLISFCPDKYIFSDVISAKEYLDFITLAYKLPLDEAPYAHIIKELGISNDKLIQEVKNLSYGTIKKVLLAAAFLPKTKLVIMDEPINGLDAMGKEWLAKQIQKRMKDTLFLITCHDTSWLEQFSPKDAWVKAAN